MSTVDISWSNLALGYILFILPVFLLYYYKTLLVRSLLIAVVRMSVQLLLVGLYLQYIFLLNSIWINVSWVLLMITTASITISKRNNLPLKIFALPLFTALVLALLYTYVFFIVFVLELENPFNARYMIPIIGMILGNCLTSSVIGLGTFYKSLKQNKQRYHFYLANGASFQEALLPFIREALVMAFNPMIATMATIGLISLPGMMTGQILGQTSPLLAIKYQIMIMISIFSAVVITVISSIGISKYFAFNKYYKLKDNI